MNENKILIILNDEDKTKDVEEIKERDNKVEVKFKGSNKKYPYDKENVIVRNEARHIDLREKDIYYKNQLLFNVDKAIRFEEFVKIIYISGDIDVINFSDISFKEHKSDNTIRDVIGYFKEIAKYVDSGKDEKEGTYSGETFLEREYNKINYVNSESVLSTYINKKELIHSNDVANNIIFPFGFNISQKEAVENVYKSDISIINGPPGTGKTQTILNIIANLAIIQNKTVAVVSNNNEAVKNVRDKLYKNGYGFICASLGKKKNRENFFDNMPKIEVDDFDIDCEVYELVEVLEMLTDKLNKLLRLNNEKARLDREISNYKLEQQHFNNYYDEQNIEKFFLELGTSNNIMELLLALKFMHNTSWIVRWIYKIKLFFKYGSRNFRNFKNNYMESVLNLQKEFYVLKIRELENNYNDIIEELDKAKFDDLQEKHKLISTYLLKKCLYDRYSNIEDEDFNNSNYKKKMKSFLERFPVILSTTYSLRNSIPRGFMFDYVIIDESSQVDLLAGSLALSCAKKAIIVGDEKQLPQIVDLKIKDKLINSEIDLCHDYFENSILSALIRTYGDNIPNKTLREHYRCHPKIIEFCNKRYYNDELIAFSNEKHLMIEKPLILYRTVPGNHMRKITKGDNKGTYNHRELDVIKEEVLHDESVIKCKDKDVGITTPYRLQANMMADSLDSEIESDTIHKYQGREKNLMILSTVLDSSYQGKRGINFVDDPCMVNVAVSRAINQFVLVTDNKLFNEEGKEIRSLIKYMKYNVLDSEIIESNLVSVFDLLYKEYSNKLDDLNNRLLSFSKYKSENIMDTILNEEFEREEYREYEYARQGMLKNLLRNVAKLTEREIKYINYGASVDFVIYDKMDKQPILFIEVDGHEFHKNNPNQLERDNLKNSICKKSNIELLRFATGDRHCDEYAIRKVIRDRLFKN